MFCYKNRSCFVKTPFYNVAVVKPFCGKFEFCNIYIYIYIKNPTQAEGSIPADNILHRAMEFQMIYIYNSCLTVMVRVPEGPGLV